MLTHRQRNVVLVFSALAFWGCGSSSGSNSPDVRAAGGPDGPSASVKDGAATPDSAVTDVAWGPDGGAQDLPRDAGLRQDAQDAIDAYVPLDTSRSDATALDGATGDGPELDSGAAVDGSVVMDGSVVVDGGGSALQVALRKVAAWVNCMPAINPDPLDVIWTVEISGAKSDSARLTQATLTASNGSVSIVQDFAADKPVISLVNGAGSADQRKPVNGAAANSACSSMCTSATYRLDLVVSVDGETVRLTHSDKLTCAY